MVAARHALAAAVALAGCSLVSDFTDSFTPNRFSGDPFPIDVDTTTASGAIMVGMQLPGDNERDAVLDVLSPLTIVDRGSAAEPSITTPDLTLLGESMPGGAFDLPRASFDETQVVALHPCDPMMEPCEVGSPTSPRAFGAIVGMPTFASDSLRLHLDPAAPQIFVLAPIAGDSNHRSKLCDGVFPSPFQGGGTLLIGGTEVQFSAWRIALDTCLAPDPTNPVASLRGTDALLVASTGVGISLVRTSAYARYQLGHPTAPDPSTLPDDSVLLSSGLVSGKHVTIPSVALVASSASNPRAPCTQTYLSHLLVPNNISKVGPPCPCGTINSTATECNDFCPVPAVVELPTAIDFLIVGDDDPTIQALSEELSPAQPQVDGILGANALAHFELDVDYPTNGRLLARCFAGDTSGQCSVRPELETQCERDDISPCLGWPVQPACTDPND
ncbi:MAG TPA: hypothetical protein VMJ10_00670 [Kofleriaceae bacterium]|nr:hypothetical protein [Kofleriaceae bacterium]